MLNNKAKAIQQEFLDNKALCQQVLSLFQLISNKSRFRILCTLSQGDFCVQEIAEIVGECKVSNISQQLRMLRLAGIIDRRREERKIIYTLVDERVRSMIIFLHEQYLPQKSEVEAI